MRRFIPLLVATVVTLSPGTAVAGGGGFFSVCSGFAEGDVVSMADSCFTGTGHFAPVGQTLTVVNDGDLPHSYTAVDGSFDTGVLEPGESYELEVEESGVVRVFCVLHGTRDGSGMAGLLIAGEPTPEALAAMSVRTNFDEALTAQATVVNETLNSQARAIEQLSERSAELSRLIRAPKPAAEPAPPTESTTLQPIVLPPESGESSNGVMAAAALAAAGLATAAAALVVSLFRRGDAGAGSDRKRRLAGRPAQATASGTRAGG